MIGVTETGEMPRDLEHGVLETAAHAEKRNGSFARDAHRVCRHAASALVVRCPGPSRA